MHYWKREWRHFRGWLDTGRHKRAIHHDCCCNWFLNIFFIQISKPFSFCWDCYQLLTLLVFSFPQLVVIWMNCNNYSFCRNWNGLGLDLFGWWENKCKTRQKSGRVMLFLYFLWFTRVGKLFQTPLWRVRSVVSCGLQWNIPCQLIAHFQLKKGPTS